MAARIPPIWFAASLSSALLIGCGSTGGSRGPSAASRSRPVPSTSSPSSLKPGDQAVAPALAACRSGVRKQQSLSASAKREISELCFRINDVIEDNEATVGAICTEVANAVAPPNATTRKRVYTDCYADYAKTLP